MEEKKDKKKPSHSMLSNAWWSLKTLLKYRPSAFAWMTASVPVNIGVQYLGIYLPSLIVAEVTEEGTLRHALFNVGIVMLLLFLGNFWQEAGAEIRSSELEVYTTHIDMMVARKRLTMFYQDYEKKEVRELAKRAEVATQKWDGVRAGTDIIEQTFKMAENIAGYFIFGTVISFASPWLVPILTIAPIVNLLAVRAYNNWEYTKRETLTELDRRLDFVKELPDDFSKAKDIRIYSMAEWLRESYRDLTQERTAWDKKLIHYNFLSRLADLIVILVRDGGAYALLIHMVRAGEIRVDQFILYFAAVASFATWVGGIVDCWNKIHAASLSICDFREYIDYPEQTGSGKVQAKEHLNTAPEIVFDKVSFRYPGAEEDTIHELSLTLHRGEKLALVGANGAGKTTLVKLLCGLYLPTAGEIRINGVPLQDFYYADYYRLLSPVFQDVKTAYLSLAETVSGKGEENTDMKRAEKCLRLAGLGEKLEALPEGIHTKLNKRVNVNGTELSGGEAQKLMLARALYKDAPLLVLDEPTAALDPIAESHIYEEYNHMCRNKTSLFISHRLASTSFCDRIILLEQGSIVEEGTHTELLQKDGKYKEMFDIQSCWYQEDEEGRIGA